MELGGICPARREPGRLRPMTRLLALSHDTPVHEHGDGSDWFHRIVLPFTAELSLMRAALSAARSEKETWN